MRSKGKTQASSVLQEIIAQAKRQGRLNIEELSSAWPADASVNETVKLLEELEQLQLPPISARPASGRAGTTAPLLTRQQEESLANQIRHGRILSLKAALGFDKVVEETFNQLLAVTNGTNLVWRLLMDFEGSDPERDEQEAIERLRSETRRLHQCWREYQKEEKRSRRRTASRWPRTMSDPRDMLLSFLTQLDFRDTFLNRLLQIVTRQAAPLEAALRTLRVTEQELDLAQGTLGGLIAIPDAQVIELLKQRRLSHRQRTLYHNKIKNLQRTIANCHARLATTPQNVLAAAAEIRRGMRQAILARQHLVESNQRLVISIARRYPHPGLDFLDLVQEGNLGLMRAADRFDATRGFRFGTYATWWVRQSIGRLLAEQSGAVRIPPHVQESLHKLNRLTRRHVVQTGTEPSVEELAQSLGKTPDRIKEILVAGRAPISTDATTGDDDDGSTLLDFIPDPHELPDEEADRRVRQTILYEALDALNEREREILLMRFQDGMTLQDVGEHFAITRERARQLQEQAIQKVKKRIKADLLRRISNDNDQLLSPDEAATKKSLTAARGMKHTKKEKRSTRESRLKETV
jgi:RNA polymerase sigma factor (sigma-70 family)